MHPKTAEAGRPALPPRQGVIVNGFRVQDAGVDAVRFVVVRFDAVRFVAVDRCGPAPEGQS